MRLYVGFQIRNLKLKRDEGRQKGTRDEPFDQGLIRNPCLTVVKAGRRNRRSVVRMLIVIGNWKLGINIV